MAPENMTDTNPLPGEADAPAEASRKQIKRVNEWEVDQCSGEK